MSKGNGTSIAVAVVEMARLQRAIVLYGAKLRWNAWFQSTAAAMAGHAGMASAVSHTQPPVSACTTRSLACRSAADMNGLSTCSGTGAGPASSSKAFAKPAALRAS